MTENQEKHKARRKALRELSKLARQLMEGPCEGMTVNEIIVEEFYTNKENKEFHTLKQWNKKGYKVKKGSEAFTVWGTTRTIEGKTTEQPQNQKPEDEEEDEFYPLCYLFSNAQVEKR